MRTGRLSRNTLMLNIYVLTNRNKCVILQLMKKRERPMPSEQIGDRWEELLNVCINATEESDLSERDQNFAADMADRLERYKGKTYVSTPQINWINRLEQQLSDLKQGFAGRGSRR
jgi:hypothetical protein